MVCAVLFGEFVNNSRCDVNEPLFPREQKRKSVINDKPLDIMFVLLLKNIRNGDMRAQPKYLTEKSSQNLSPLARMVFSFYSSFLLLLQCYYKNNKFL